MGREGEREGKGEIDDRYFFTSDSSLRAVLHMDGKTTICCFVSSWTSSSLPWLERQTALRIAMAVWWLAAWRSALQDAFAGSGTSWRLVLDGAAMLFGGWLQDALLAEAHLGV